MKPGRPPEPPERPQPPGERQNRGRRGRTTRRRRANRARRRTPTSSASAARRSRRACRAPSRRRSARPPCRSRRASSRRRRRSRRSRLPTVNIDGSEVDAAPEALRAIFATSLRSVSSTGRAPAQPGDHRFAADHRAARPTTASSACGGRNTSMRDPNFIKPMRSPRVSALPFADAADDPPRQHADDLPHDDRLAAADRSRSRSARSAPRLRDRPAGTVPGRYSIRVTRPSTGVRLMWTSSGDRKIVTCCQSPGGAHRGSAGPAIMTRPSAGDDDQPVVRRNLPLGIAEEVGRRRRRAPRNPVAHP